MILTTLMTRTTECRRLRHRTTTRRGSILVVVFVVISLLSYGCYQFVIAASDQHRTIAAAVEQVRLELGADSGEEFLKVVLQDPTFLAPANRSHAPANRSHQDVLRDFRGIALSQSSRPIVPKEGFTVIGWELGDQNQLQLQYHPSNESSRVSLEAIARWEKEQPGTGRQSLMQLPGMDLELATAILRLLGASSSLEMGPTESEATSLADGFNYSPMSSGLFSLQAWQGLSLQELMRIPQISQQTLFGLDYNRNFHISAFETATGSTTLGTSRFAPEEPPLHVLITPYSAERNTTSNGLPRVYLNLGDLTVLEQQLSKRLPAHWVDFILAYRRYGPVASAAANSPDKPANPVKELPGNYITSVYDLIGTAVATKSTAEGTEIISSPFSTQPSEMREYLMRLVDEVTVDWRQIIPGRININDAPPAVLRCIPGLDHNLVERIVAARQGEPASSTGHREHAAWLLAEGWIGIEWMRSLEPYITGRGDVYRAQIISYLVEEYETERPAAGQPRLNTLKSIRREIVIDAANNPPRVIYRKDLANLGQGYSTEVVLPD